jgi:60 kDa SS-A/Ro ribonucleoprotein
MANPSLFKSSRGKTPRPVPLDEKGIEIRNEAGGLAYQFDSRHALAQYAATGCLSSTYYASDKEQLDKVLNLVRAVDSEFVAKTAIYARQQAFMKDMPALLVAILAARSKMSNLSLLNIERGVLEEACDARALFQTIFPQVIDNGKMLRNFVQIIRSGALGRRSFGTMPQRVMRQWFDSRSPEAVFRASVGKDPSMADIIRMVRPKARGALYPYIIGYPSEEKVTAKQKELRQFYKPEELPELCKQYEAFKADPAACSDMPKVPFQMLDSLPLTTKQWTEIALNGGWHFVRMNLNTFARHGVLKNEAVVKKLAKKLADPKEIAKAKVFPYQLFMAYLATESNSEIPRKLKLALQDAVEIATRNVPSFGDNVWVFPDVSGSMTYNSVTGYRKGATSKVKPIDVAALMSACVLRTTPEAQVIPVDTQLHTAYQPNPKDSIVTNANKLRKFGGCGTHLELALNHLVKTRAKADVVIYVSDNQSWVGAGGPRFGGRIATGMEAAWQQVSALNPQCKLICIDVQPYETTQVMDANTVLNIGGFSDNVFKVIKAFCESKDANHWVEEIDAIKL